MRLGLVARTAVWCALYALLMAGVAAVVLAAVAERRQADRAAARAAQVRADVVRAEYQLLDLDRTERGYLVTHDAGLLGSWSAQQDRLADRIDALQRSGQDPRQAERARRLSLDTHSYVQDHALPALRAAQAGSPGTSGPAALRDGDRRIALLHDELDDLAASDERLAEARDQRADALVQVMRVAAVTGIVASVLVGVCLVGYLERAVVRPLRRAAGAAGEMAQGRLEARVPEGGAGEIGRLARAFNAMGGSMQRSVAQLVRYGRTQAALRRVATRIAQGASPAEALDAVVVELGRLVGTDGAHIVRFDDGEGTVLAAWAAEGIPAQVGARLPLDGDSVSARVYRTGRPARMDDYAEAAGPLAARMREHNVRAAVGAPIIVEGRLWGVVTATVHGEQPLAAEAEERVADYTELVATTIANAQTRADLAASRARVVVAADQVRRRIERHLHDAIQQQLIAVHIGLGAAQEGVPPDLPHVRQGVASATERLGEVLDQLREMSRGIHPAILTDRGLGAALKTLARRSGVPAQVELDLSRRLPEPVEVAAYYIAVETLDNAAKHADATFVRIEAADSDRAVRLSVSDDGAGGADPERGSGLLSLADRVHALGGSLVVTSPPGGGTRVEAELPLDSVPLAAATARLT
ncbi:HAMP domain-containing protein [Dactylosporangium sp. NPDC051485]|uniref:sensor histidine kinase n=1 Tax=Dactylosporangium sp. NPDC051485 TaxID=3154846 RepID=UPI00342CD394